jgi:prepilin-type processing-associated H-X9-DG protein
MATQDHTQLPVRFDPANLNPSGGLAGNTSYEYNPHWAPIDPNVWAGFCAAHGMLTTGNGGGVCGTGAVGDPCVANAYKRISEYPSYLALASDAIVDTGNVSHPLGKASAVFNLLYADGHVQQVSDEYVIRSLQGGMPFGIYQVAGMTGGITLSNNSTTLQSLQLIDDYLDILETEAGGNNPLKQDAIPPANGKYLNMVGANPTPLSGREDEIHGGNGSDTTLLLGSSGPGTRFVKSW